MWHADFGEVWPRPPPSVSPFGRFQQLYAVRASHRATEGTRRPPRVLSWLTSQDRSHIDPLGGSWTSPRHDPVGFPRVSMNSLNRTRSPFTRRSSTPSASPTDSTAPSGLYSTATL